MTGVVAGLGSSPEKAKPEVLMQVERLECAIDALRDSVAEIEKRLAPVMRSQPVDDDEGKSPEAKDACMMSGVIRMKADLVYDLNDKINSLIRRLEI